jgi:hypothetical protein
MKIRFNRNCLIDIQKVRLNETWDRQFKKWDELLVEELNYNIDKRTVHILTYEGDVLLYVPNDAFEVI